ncbi:hypothetical protein [Sphingomonas sp. 1P08PE]|uniref:hypothetical protein n=1 Tax=Sphingomonas sp. 1P08PE TaxID=554122 RepID=UPI0039A33EE7
MASTLDTVQSARLAVRAGPVRLRARVAVTPAGLLAIGGLVAMILLSVPPIVRAARRPHAGGAIARG